jgi:hypothetical protein
MILARSAANKHRPGLLEQSRRTGRRLFYTVLLTGLVGLPGCVTSQADRILETRGDLPSRITLTDVPLFPQETLRCGPAAAAMVLSWSGVPVRPKDLVSQIYSPAREGSLTVDMVGAARRHGRIVYPIATLDHLLAEVAAGHPVLVLQDLGYPLFQQWHFAVVVGYDLDAAEIALHSGDDFRESQSLRRFEQTWKPGGYWAAVVLPPSRLPATARKPAYLNAAVGLERARRPAAAAQAYETALIRWPASANILIGLGNSRYASGDLTGAETAFRAAVAADSENAPALNNLAHVLAKSGRRDDAIAAVRKALELGGPMADTYRLTLAEILNEPRQNF